MKRGRYSGDRRHELKFRAGPDLFQQLKSISVTTECAMARVIREMVENALYEKSENDERKPQRCVIHAIGL